MPTIRTLTPQDYRRTRWKNGGGETSEIAVFPASAGLDDFLWRVSIAEINRDGPFSPFAGVERTIVLLQGDGVRLTGNGESLEVRVPFAPVTFAGDVAMHGTLLGGPSRDFNLMVRRADARGTVAVVRAGGGSLPLADTYVCYAAKGTVACAVDGEPSVDLPPAHALVMTGKPCSVLPALRVNPAAAAVALVALIVAIAGARA